VAQPIVPEVEVYRAPRGKWVKPKGLEKLQHKPRQEPAAPKIARAPRPRPKMRDDNPEQWGQYYFRDAILDQLDTYFVYLRRMRRADKDAYELHRQLGIHLMPQSAVGSFDQWRTKEQTEDLSAWWKSHRPGFGAVSYGLDKSSVEFERMKFADLPPEEFARLKAANAFGRLRNRDLPENGSRISTVTGTNRDLPGLDNQRIGIFWVPKFLYFNKWKRAPAHIQKVSDGDVYAMTIYWDRVDGLSRSFHKRHKGGVPQDYAVCVERESGQVRILRMLLNEQVNIRSSRNGERFSIPFKRWGYPTECLTWASGRADMSPEDYLRRCFMEAALMYESASLGSMIRVEAAKGNLSAVFGVEIKRTSYFFKDRDVVLNDKGSVARIFHIVRPHTRTTKDGPIDVKMHFRGLKQFEWANHKVSITVPGLDHFHLSDFDIGSLNDEDAKKYKGELMGGAAVGKFLKHDIKAGAGRWK
jgi:hypothetical protein